MLRCPGCSGTCRPAAVNAPALTRAGSRRPGACQGTNLAARSTAGTTNPATGSAPIADLPVEAAHPARHALGCLGWLQRVQAGGARLDHLVRAPPAGLLHPGHPGAPGTVGLVLLRREQMPGR